MSSFAKDGKMGRWREDWKERKNKGMKEIET